MKTSISFKYRRPDALKPGLSGLLVLLSGLGLWSVLNLCFSARAEAGAPFSVRVIEGFKAGCFTMSGVVQALKNRLGKRLNLEMVKLENLAALRREALEGGTPVIWFTIEKGKKEQVRLSIQTQRLNGRRLEISSSRCHVEHISAALIVERQFLGVTELAPMLPNPTLAPKLPKKNNRGRKPVKRWAWVDFRLDGAFYADLENTRIRPSLVLTAHFFPWPRLGIGLAAAFDSSRDYQLDNVRLKLRQIPIYLQGRLHLASYPRLAIGVVFGLVLEVSTFAVQDVPGSKRTTRGRLGLGLGALFEFPIYNKLSICLALKLDYLFQPFEVTVSGLGKVYGSSRIFLGGSLGLGYRF